MVLCRERLARIQRVLNKHAGALSIRDFTRTYRVGEWEIERAAALDWIQIKTRKPRTGRPSRIVQAVSNPETAKLPPFRAEIERPISTRHWRFALFSTMEAVKGGSSWAGGLPCFTDAYLKAFPNARKRRAAAASMSRLLQHPNVQAARAWNYSQFEGVIPRWEAMPRTAGEIWQRLREAGSWRVGG